MPTVLYTYDPLDRLIQTAGIRRFYNSSRMTTEIQGAVQRSVFQVGDHVLAEGGAGGSNLLATDLQRSVLHTVNPDKTQPMAYNVYGHRPAESGVASVLGFNGERADPMTGHYLLGNGYRAFNPVLMRFNSPDNMSPFGKGGVNSYAYCNGNPVLRTDPTGHFISALIIGAGRLLDRTFGGFIERHAQTILLTTSRAIQVTGGALIGVGLSKSGPTATTYLAMGTTYAAIGGAIEYGINRASAFINRGLARVNPGVNSRLVGAQRVGANINRGQGVAFLQGQVAEHEDLVTHMDTQALAAHEELTRAFNTINAQQVEITQLRASGGITPVPYRDSNYLFGPPPAYTSRNANHIRRRST